MKKKFQAVKFKKTYSSYSINIYECELTKMKIEYWAFNKFYVLFDENNMIVWEFNTLSEAKSAAYYYYQDSKNLIIL